MVLSFLFRQTPPIPPGGPNGNGTNGTSVDLTPEKVGPVGQSLQDLGVPYPPALGAIATFIVAAVVLYVLGRSISIPVTNRVLAARGVEAHARGPLLRLVKLVVGGLAISIAFGVAGYGNILTSLATIGAAATLAIGFALQDVLKNFVAGVFVYTDRPFQIGDWIEWGAGSYAGVVQDISFRVTRVRTFDNELLTVPNSQLTDETIKNPVANDQLRIPVAFGIGYDDDIEQAREIVVEEAETHPEILDDPEPIVRMSTEGALADSSVGLASFIWIADPSRADFLRVRGEYIRNVKRRFNAAGIEIPFPQVDLSGGIGLATTARCAE